MWSLNQLSSHEASLIELCLRNYFSKFRGRDTLAQIWFGRPTQDTAISMGDCMAIFEQDLPTEIDPLTFAESQEWFARLNIMTMELEGNISAETILCTADVLLHVIRPIVRKVALACFEWQWSRVEEQTIRSFTSDGSKKNARTKICDWAEAFVFGGSMSQESRVLYFAPLLMPAFGKTFDELESLDWTNSQYQFLPFEPPTATVQESNKPKLAEHPDILEYMHSSR